MDVGRQTDLQEERMRDRRSLSSNYRYCSQSRKMSVGVLVDSISKANTKDPQEPGPPITETETYSKRNVVKDREGHTPLMEKHEIVEPKDASPWVSTRSFNPKVSSSVAVQDTERTPSFPATRRTRPRSKLLEKVSASHSLKFFPAKSGLGSDICRHKNFGKDIRSMDAGKVDDAENMENLVHSTEQGVRLEKEQVQGKDRTTETGGHETLRMKLWEILGNASSPNKHLPSLQCQELHLDQERNKKQSPIEKINLNSDTIESDSQTHIFTRPMTRSLTRRKDSTRKQSKNSEATKSIDRNDCQRKRIFSFKGDRSGGLYDNSNDGSLPSKRKKILGMSFGPETHQGVKPKNVEERQQLEKSRSIPAVEKLMVHKNKVSNASSCSGRRNDVIDEPKKGTKNNTSFESSLNAMTDQRDVEQSMDIETSKKNQQEDISDSLLKKKRNSVQDPSTPPSEIKSRGSLPKKGTKNNSLFESPLNTMTDQRDVEQSMDIKTSKKNQQEDISDSLLKKKRNSVHDPSTPPSEIKSRGSLPKSKQEELHGQGPAEKIFNTTNIRSFKSLLSPKSAECRPDVQQEPSVGRYKQNNSPKSSFLVKPSIVMDEDGDNRISKSSTDEMDSESSEDESHKDYRESEELSPEIRISENILPDSNKSHDNDKDVGVIGSSPASDSLKGVHDASKLEMYLEENHGDDLTRAVALFTMALAHIKTKLKSISSRRSADILRAAVEEIFFRLQNAESLIKTDMVKLANLSHSTSKQLETRFQEKQEELLGIHKRFKAEVEQHLQDCGGLIEDLEEHQIELKRSVEKQKAAHKKFLSQVEQEINAQLDDAECRIMAVEKDDDRSYNVNASMKRKRVAQVHHLSQKRGGDKISKRLRALRSLIPNCTKIDKASVLDEAIEYLKLLQLQLQIMPFFAGLCVPPTQMILPTQYPIIGCSAIDLRFGLPFAGYGTRFQMPLPMNARLPVASASLQRSAQQP
ncbi:hypothetical protein C2S52_007083 [Perilla frutescens var. hirtella]|nr:hypothetical protein C2S51_008770 [Perilla frutescens var. frutescens]KAH6787531.1 hypothetical protein C2S52_007083 [Perilla frutescens var. hirtella]